MRHRLADQMMSEAQMMDASRRCSSKPRSYNGLVMLITLHDFQLVGMLVLVVCLGFLGAGLVGVSLWMGIRARTPSHE